MRRVVRVCRCALLTLSIAVPIALPIVGSSGCGGASSEEEGGEDAGGPLESYLYDFAGGCYVARAGDDYLAASGEDYGFQADEEGAARLYLKAADLGTYLLYDETGGYVVFEDGPLSRQVELESKLSRVDDTYISGALWGFESAGDGERVLLRNLRNDALLGSDGLVDEPADAAKVTFEPAEGCMEHPELTLDAQGSVERTTFEDGDLYGIVDTHSHILSNFGFGGGGIFHGSAFHPLGVEHALGSCEPFHGEMGRKDFFGFAFDTAGPDNSDLSALLTQLIAGELTEDNHATDGWPTFSEWPDAGKRSTHQTQYYKWLERAHLSGLRLVVQHATTNSVICHITAGEGHQPVRYDCSDMVAVNRIIEETYAMERYIDAQAGGPGEGFFRIVFSPEEAREVIAEGKMAVVLGIETSDLFDCTLSPRPGGPICDEEYVVQQLDAYYDLGVRVLFPVHKYDNAFSAGDGDRAFIELGNFLNSGYWGNYTEDCPGLDHGFDRGPITFGGLNMPRSEYMLPEPPNDFSGFPDAPLDTALPFIEQIIEPPLEGEYCQNHGLTDLGEFLIDEMMARGMILELDHLPQRGFVRAYEILEENDYPAAGTHGRNQDGELYALGGVSKTNIGRCRNPDEPGATLSSLADRVALIEENGGYPAEGFGFDLNGFAGARGPRFGDGACPEEQSDPVTYPFRSFADDVEFTAPSVAERDIDFNTEGFVHIGMLPELLEDARGDAVSDDELEPLFRSAEGYVRMWEKAEERANAMSVDTSEPR